MTTKTKYYAVIALVAAITLAGSIMYSTQTVSADRIEGLSIGRNNLVEEAKNSGSAYITSVPVSHSEQLRKGLTNQIPVEVTLVSENDDSAWVILKPVVSGQYTVLNEKEASISDAQVKNAFETGVMPDGMYDKSDFISFNVDTITLKANQPQQILVTLSVADDLAERYTDNPFRLNIGYELIDSNIGDKIPRDYEPIEIRSEN